MMRTWSVPLLLACSFAAGLTVSAHGQSQGQSRDPIITSDTTAYCGVLRNRITGLTRGGAVSNEAVTLSAEGERMCEQGQIRGGIMRLRRAIAIMRHPGD